MPPPQQPDFPSTAGGFVAGTLVHTREGLRPIEQITLGDWVLSKSLVDEHVEYKKVIYIETRKSSINYFAYRAKTLVGDTVQGTIFVAPQHLVWSAAGSWREFGSLTKMSSRTRLYGEELLKALSARTLKLYISASPSVAWLPRHDSLDALGAFVDLQHFKMINNPETGDPKEEFFGLDLGRPRKRPQPRDLYQATVYDLGVEDYQTCCIGNPGIWVAAAAGQTLHYAPVRAPIKKKAEEPIRLSIFELRSGKNLPETYAQAKDALADISSLESSSKLEALGVQLAQSLSCCIEPNDNQKSVLSVRLPENDIPFARLGILNLAASQGLVVADVNQTKIWLPTGLILSQGLENSWRYNTQQILPRKKCMLSRTEYLEVITTYLMKVLAPLGFEKITDRKIKEDRDFYFLRSTEIGTQYVSGHMSQIFDWSTTLWIDSGGHVEDVRQVLEPALKQDSLYQTHWRHNVLGYFDFPIVYQIPDRLCIDIGNLEQLEAELERLECFLPKLLQQGKTFAGLDSILNGAEELRSGWAMIQRVIKGRSYFPLAINALGNNKQLEAIADQYREIIRARSEGDRLCSHRLNLESVDCIVKHLNAVSTLSPLPTTIPHDS